MAETSVAEKAPATSAPAANVPPDMHQIVRRSVQDLPDTAAPAAADPTSSLLWMVSNSADEMLPWGQAPKRRDKQLRAFWPTESILAGAMGTVVARYSGLDWLVEGGTQTADVMANVLNASDYYDGFESMVAKVALDYLSQDSGAFIQFIRQFDDPAAPVVMLTHLDAGRMFPTGNPVTPYFYLNRKNKYVPMNWYQVANLMEMPSPAENVFAGVLYKQQYCAVTRVLRSAQILRNIAIYKDEKTAGRFLRAVHIVSGVTNEEVQDAITKQRLQADAAGALRHIQPLIVSTLDPKATVSLQTLELASLPDGFDEEKTMKGYLLGLSLGFLTDYQEFSPLPGGGLGTAAQSDTLHQKSRGKGVQIFKMRMAHAINTFVMPANCVFKYDEADIEAEAKEAEVKATRATRRQTMITDGELDAVASRKLAVEEGDLPEELLAELEARDAQRKLEEQAAAQAQATALAARLGGGGGPGGPPAKNPATSSGATKAYVDEAVHLLTEGVKDDEYRVELGAFLQTRIHRAFTDAADDLAALGYMDTEGRIVLSSIIGDALRLFSERINEDAAAVSLTMLEDEDVRRLLKSIGQVGADERKFKVVTPPARKKAEQAFQTPLEQELNTIFENLQLRIQRLTEGEKSVTAARPVAGRKGRRRVREERKVQRDADGRISGQTIVRTEDE